MTPDNVNSESTAVDIAFTSRMLDQAFNITDENSLMPVLHGRMGTGPMSFSVGTETPVNITVASAQMEIDATFENKNSIVILEAKKVPEVDFLVRQLFYPYYVLRHNRGVSKDIIPTFLVILGTKYYFVKYNFSDPGNYSSIQRIGQAAFYFKNNTHITLEDIYEWMENVEPIPEPDIPFPQADSYQQFISTLAFLNDAESGDGPNGEGMTTLEIAESLGSNGYANRQGAYYGNLLHYFGLAKYTTNGNSGYYSITEEGRFVYKNIDTDQGQERIIKLLLQHKPFRAALNELHNHESIFTNDSRLPGSIYERVAQAIADSGGLWNTKTKKYEVSNKTLLRRSRSVVSLLRSFIRNIINSYS